MPIAVEVVSPEEFEQWVVMQGGSMPGSEDAAEEGGEDAPADEETETADDAAEIAVADTAATAS